MSSHESKNEMEEKMRATTELRKHQKDLANAEADRRCFAHEIEAYITKQHTKIDNLKSENYNLRDFIAKMNDDVITKTHNFMDKNLNAEQITQKYRGMIKGEEGKLSKINQDIKIIEDQIVAQKRAIGGVNAGLENQNSLVKQIKILENRLDKANQKFNEAISINRNLRQQIDSLRRERVIFDNLYRKLEKELHDKRKKMAEIIETANNAYEERDKANNQIQHLKTQAQREAKNFENELKALSQLAENQRRTREVASLAQDRGGDPLNNQADPNKVARSKNTKILKETTIDPDLREQHRKLCVDFARIQAATHIKNFNELATKFIEMEEKNFNMFKYVIELSNEVEALERQIYQYKQDRMKYENRGNDLTVKKNNYLKQLDSKSLESRNRTEKFSSKCSSAQKTLNSVKKYVHTLFTTIDCDASKSQEISQSEGVTESNLMEYFSIIEDRIVRILCAYGYIMSDRNVDNVQISKTRKKKKPRNQNQSRLKEMPSLEENLDDNDDFESSKRMTYEQLRQKAIESLEREAIKRSQVKGKNKRI